jgi:hypothetical protein
LHSSGDWISNLDVHIPNLLANKIRVLVYSGMLGMLAPPSCVGVWRCWHLLIYV